MTKLLKPVGWIEANLGEFLEFKYGKSLPERMRSGQGFPVYGSNGIIGYHNSALTEGETLIIGRKGSAGKVNYSPEACFPIDTTYYVDQFHSMSARYWFYLLNHFELGELNKATAIPGLNREDAYRVVIQVAPLNEQKRIADKLDTLLRWIDACQSRLNRVQLILDRFRQAVLTVATSGQLTEDWRIENNNTSLNRNESDTSSFDFLEADCFGDYRFPSTWKPQRLGDIAEIKTGIAKNSKKQDPSDKEVPYLRVANVQRGYFDLSEVKTIRVPYARLDDLLLKPGDILLNEGGDIDKLGRGWVWSGEIEQCVFQNHVFRARLYDNSFNPKFFSHYGNSRGVDYFLAYGKQTTNLASISKSALEALPVVVPPVEEQHEIVRQIEKLLALAGRVEAHCRTTQTHIEHLTPILLSKAFRGELMLQDPNDEPASVLLERIRAERAVAVADSEVRPQQRKLSTKSETRSYVEVMMLKRTDIQDTHLSNILKARGPLTAEALWSASQLDIDDFYDQLKDEEARELLKETWDKSPVTPRLLEAS